jgi:hypothetical protein
VAWLGTLSLNYRDRERSPPRGVSILGTAASVAFQSLEAISRALAGASNRTTVVLTSACTAHSLFKSFDATNRRTQ